MVELLLLPLVYFPSMHAGWGFVNMQYFLSHNVLLNDPTPIVSCNEREISYTQDSQYELFPFM